MAGGHAKSSRLNIAQLGFGIIGMKNKGSSIVLSIYQYCKDGPKCPDLLYKASSKLLNGNLRQQCKL